MATPIEEFDAALRQHAPQFAIDLSDERIDLLKLYYSLLLQWNARLHLVGPCTPVEFALRHVLESLLLLKHFPQGAAVVDVGSGGGLPMVPCLLVRDDLRATLIESSQKKVVFLREALRPVNSQGRALVSAARFEELTAPPSDFLTCRAIERFSAILPTLVDWAPTDTTFLLFGSEELAKQLRLMLPSVTAELVPSSQRRYLIIGRRESDHPQT